MALGHTIGELQQKISWAEYVMWMDYRVKYGPLNPIRKYDQGPAIVATQMNHMNGGKALVSDFIYYGKDTEESNGKSTAKEEVSLEAFVKSLGGVKIGQRKRG